MPAPQGFPISNNKAHPAPSQGCHNSIIHTYPSSTYETAPGQNIVQQDCTYKPSSHHLFKTASYRLVRAPIPAPIIIPWYPPGTEAFTFNTLSSLTSPPRLSPWEYTSQVMSAFATLKVKGSNCAACGFRERFACPCLAVNVRLKK